MSSSICFAQYVFLVLISKFSFHSLWGKSWRNAIFKENEIVGRELVCCRFHVLLSHGWIVIQYVSSFQILYWCDYGGQIHIITYQLLMKVSLHKKTLVSNFFLFGGGGGGEIVTNVVTQLFMFLQKYPQSFISVVNGHKLFLFDNFYPSSTRGRETVVSGRTMHMHQS